MRDRHYSSTFFTLTYSIPTGANQHQCISLQCTVWSKLGILGVALVQIKQGNKTSYKTYAVSLGGCVCAHMCVLVCLSMLLRAYIPYNEKTTSSIFLCVVSAPLLLPLIIFTFSIFSPPPPLSLSLLFGNLPSVAAVPVITVLPDCIPLILMSFLWLGA